MDENEKFAGSSPLASPSEYSNYLGRSIGYITQRLQFYPKDLPD